MATLSKPAPRAEWLPIAGLVLLGLVPTLGGASRLASLAGGLVTPETARFFALPLPIVLHVVFAVPYALLGALQFSDRLRRRSPRWHRTAGKVLVMSGLVVALSGIWMTLAYPITKPGTDLPAFDGLGVFAVRLLAGVGMTAALVLGYATIRRGQVLAHQAWMLRAYALGMGAGTQVLTHLPWFLFPGIRGELARTLCMAAGWGINLAIAEWLIARKRAG
jgi:uncharacterized membrane protein